MKTFYDYCNDIGLPYSPANIYLISGCINRVEGISGNKYTYLTEYAKQTPNNHVNVDSHYMHKYKDMGIIDDVTPHITSLIASVLDINDYKYQKLYDTLNLDYNPIWNVDGTETTTTTYGEHTSTDNIGARTNNEDINQYRVPMDSGTKTLTDETTTSNSTQSAVDSHVSNTHTDTIVNERHGNIGVTSTQHLITEERQVAMFTLYDIIFEDIMKCIGVPIWESEDVTDEY